MVHDIKGQHHFHKRKKRELHPNKYKRFLDRIIYAVGIFGPIMTIPQLWKIWVYQNATGVSATSWIAYLICAIVWMFYGIVHKDKPIIFTYSIWIILEIFIVVGTLMYG